MCGFYAHKIKNLKPIIMFHFFGFAFNEIKIIITVMIEIKANLRKNILPNSTELLNYTHLLLVKVFCLCAVISNRV